ncbi:MAG TPA: HEAT repeat domain-containing protein [Methylomirabilota bacterium]|nr:HEAT repeat domain-containing protein [Methylomirabilota bacterium]
MKAWILGAAVAVLGAFVLMQAKTTSDLRKQVIRLETQLAGIAMPGEAPATANGRSTQPTITFGTLPHRVHALEERVEAMSRATDVLVARGMVPPSASQLEQMASKFYDPAASDRDRLAAFRLMRRNGQLNEEAVAMAATWLQGTTNANTKRELLGQMDGMTNEVLKQPLLAMMNTETDGRVREELADVLADFAADPAVESKLWELALNDPNGDVREEAREALTDGPMTPQRLDAFKTRAANAQLPLDDRLMSLEGLREANATPPELVRDLAQLAQTSTDPVARVKLFDAFDGINDPSVMPALVNGLQDANPVVRERAADALSSFCADPRIQEWLNHIIQTDNDPRVKREAHQALAESQRRRNRRD